MIATGGGVVTEYPYRTRALPQRFVQRNRIVAGLSLGTIVVESAERGGSLITANIAFDYGRSVLVAPGRIFDPASKGCNKLVAHQKASIITTPDKLLDELQLLPTLKPQRLPFEEEQEESNPILKALRTADHLTLEDLALQLGEEVPTISGMLFELELNGQIHSLPEGDAASKTIKTMKRLYQLLLSLLVTLTASAQSNDWYGDKYSLFVHYGLYSIPGGVFQGEPVTKGYSEQILTFGIGFSDWYEAYTQQLDAAKFDAQEIVALAQKGGMRSVVMTSKHHDGFCLFDTETTDYNVMNTPPRGISLAS